MRLATAALWLAACAEPYEPGYASGTQAAVRWYQASDGTRHFSDWIDRASGQPCGWLDPGDGIERCLPDGVVPIRQYRDPGCSDGLIAAQASVGYEIRDGRFTAYVPGDSVELTTWYAGSPDSCQTVTSPDQPQRFRPRAAALPDSRFAAVADRALVGERGDLRAIVALGSDGSRRPLWEALEVSSDTRCQVVSDGAGGGWCPVGGTRLVDALRGDGRLRWRVLADPDGDYASPPLGPHDRALGADCWFTEVEGGLCLPDTAAAPSNFYTDEACLDGRRGIVTFGQPAAVRHPDGTRVFRLGEPVINAKIIDPGDGACQYLINSWSALPIVETLEADDLVSAVLTVDP